MDPTGMNIKSPKRIVQLLHHEKSELFAQIADTSNVMARWQTVRDVISDLPDPRSNSASRYKNHEFRDGARSYEGHSGSVMDEPSKTIKAGVHGVPGGENTILLDDRTLRYYTVRDSARLQTFSDHYFFQSSWSESMRQLGNAVPVDLAKVIGISVGTQIERILS
jgi:DNA (cytosine-5)-methyltransferase 1